jgi:polar amino acid transport system substrate-binding protein
MEAERNSVGIDPPFRSFQGAAVKQIEPHITFNRRDLIRFGGGAISAAAVMRSGAALAQGGGLLAQLREKQVARVAFAAQPPYSELKPDGSLSGIAPIVSQTIMQRLGVPKLEGITVTYAEIIPGLMAGRWDFIAACLAISGTRCKQVSYADPIVFDPAVVAYLPSEVSDVPNTVEAIGKTGLKTGTIAGLYALRQVQHAIGANLTIFPDNAALIDGMINKRVQVALCSLTGFKLIQTMRTTQFKVSEPLTDILIAGSGPAFRQTDTDLYQAFQGEMRKMRQSGEIAALNQQFGFTYVREKYDAMTAERACEIAS